jgi:L-iditol 2-dehydrogenase
MEDKMNGAVFYGPYDMRVAEIPTPVCPVGGALIKLSGALICGTDIKIYKNGHPRINPPIVIGHEMCGRIVDIDSKDCDLKVGDRVTVQTTIPCGKCRMCHEGFFNICEDLKGISQDYNGAFAEYVAIPEQAMRMGNLIKVSYEDMSDEMVCLAEPLGCVINGQELLDIKPGEDVLIIGAGPIGILHAELARISGAGRVFLAENSINRLNAARHFEFTHYINTDNSNLTDEVMRLTSNRGVDAAIVTAPAKSAMEQAVDALALRGRLSLFASLAKGDSNITIDSRPVHYKELKIVGSSSSAVRHMKKALNILSTGSIKTDKIITHKLPLEKIVEGLELGIKGEALKVYLKMD